MIVSDVEKFIFIRNPKCGGTTVRTSLMEFDDRDNNYWMFENFYGKKIDKAHLPLDMLKKYFPEKFRLSFDYFVFVFVFVFGFVRHSIDRFISSFNEANQKLFNSANMNEVSEEEYSFKINQCAESLNTGRVSARDFGFRHFVEQHKMYFFRNKCYADKIMKVEGIQDCPDIFSILKPNLTNAATTWIDKKINVKKLGFNPKDSLNPSSVKNLHKIYEKDFLLFTFWLSIGSKY